MAGMSIVYLGIVGKLESFTDNYIAKGDLWQTYGLITDIEKYPLFIPWCLDVKICEYDDPKHNDTIVLNTDAHEKIVFADTIVGFGPFKLAYHSKIIMTPPCDGYATIQVTSNDKLFKRLYTEWKLTESVTNEKKNGEKARAETLVEFYIEFEFTSSIHKTLATSFFQSACRKMTAAFREREGIV